MTDDFKQPNDPGIPPSGAPTEFTQNVERPQISAVVPEAVAKGAFATAPLVFTGQHEIVIDFMLSISKPNLLATRVVLPPGVAAQLVIALQQNLDNYRQRFGGPVEPPPPPTPQQPDVKEIYERHKIADSQLSGCYANAVLITHSYSEFCFDFITTFFPRAAVSARVYMAAPLVPAFFRTLHRSVEQYKAKMIELQQQMEQQKSHPGTHRPTEPKPPFDPPTIV